MNNKRENVYQGLRDFQDFVEGAAQTQGELMLSIKIGDYTDTGDIHPVFIDIDEDQLSAEIAGDRDVYLSNINEITYQDGIYIISLENINGKFLFERIV